MFDRVMARVGLAVGAAMVVASPVWASSYSAEYVFGDSLSDNGNLAEVYYHQNLPNPPSYGDSFSNGPVAAALLANSIGLTLTPSLWVTAFTDPYNLFGGAAFVPGTNYAVASATAAAQAVGGPPGINLPQQVAAYSAFASGHADPNALYVVDIGGNDVRAAALQGTGTAALAAGVQAEIAAVATLAGEGAQHVLVVNVPDVGVIPEFAQDNPTLAGTATLYTQDYDAALAAGLASLPLSNGVSLAQFDLYTYNNDLLANPSMYGLTDTTDRCFTNTPFSAATSPQCGPNAANINQLVYWDAIHPTETVQALWATGFETALGQPVPEPSSAGLLGAGLLALIGLTARRQRRA